MSGRNSLRAELDEQRCLIEKQQVQIDRLIRQIEMQSHQTADIQGHLDQAPVSRHRSQTRSANRIHG